MAGGIGEGYGVVLQVTAADGDGVHQRLRDVGLGSTGAGVARSRGLAGAAGCVRLFGTATKLAGDEDDMVNGGVRWRTALREQKIRVKGWYAVGLSR
jgi:hypothetical protein